MAKRTPFREVKAALGCSIFAIFGVGILGIVLSLFTDNMELAWSIRKRCLLGLAIGIAMLVAWKIASRHLK